MFRLYNLYKLEQIQTGERVKELPRTKMSFSTQKCYKYKMPGSSASDPFPYKSEQLELET